MNTEDGDLNLGRKIDKHLSNNVLYTHISLPWKYDTVYTTDYFFRGPVILIKPNRRNDCCINGDDRRSM